MIPSRRGFILGATAFLAAPSIVRVASLMPVSAAPITEPAFFRTYRADGNWLTIDGLGLSRRLSDGLIRLESGPSVMLPANAPAGMTYTINLSA